MCSFFYYIFDFKFKFHSFLSPVIDLRFFFQLCRWYTKVPIIGTETLLWFENDKFNSEFMKNQEGKLDFFKLPFFTLNFFI